MSLNKVFIKTVKGSHELTPKNVESLTGGSHWYKTIVSEKEREVIDAIIQSALQSSKVTIRIQGAPNLKNKSYYTDRELRADEIERLKYVLLSYEMLKSQ
jgi:hypothetical protein